MPLTCVTITGADDATSIEELVALCEEFPFVEWGILVGYHEGCERFPSQDWITNLVSAREGMCNHMRLSLHICGRHLRDIASGRSTLGDWLGPQLYAFQRVQLNWHGERQSQQCSENVLSAFCKLDGFGWDPTLIFQLDGVNDDLYLAASRRFACCGLFDRSHGAGVVPNEWPQCSTDIACGWAGGLGPENLADEIPKISSKAWPAMNFWIDMETRVRSGSSLDIAKVRQCLDIAKPFIVSVY